jgi:hypothetical protein
MLLLLIFSACTDKTNYDKNKLGQSRYLYIISEAKDRAGLMNEKGEIVMGIQKREIKKLDAKGHFFAIDNKILFSIRDGIIPLKIDSFTLESTAVFSEKPIFIAKKEKSWMLIGDKGQIINTFNAEEKLIYDALKNYYHIKNDTQSRIFDASTHKLVLTVKSVIGIKEHPKNKNLLQIIKSGEIEIFNADNPQHSYIKEKKETDFILSYLFNSYWNAAADSLPVILASEEEMKDLDNAFETDFKKFSNKKVFGYINQELKPVSETRYSYKQLSEYNPYFNAIQDEKSSKYILWQHGKEQKDLPTFYQVYFSSYPVWIYGITESKTYLPFYKGKVLSAVKSETFLHFGPNYFISCLDDKEGLRELRDSSAKILIAAAKQKFLTIDSKNKKDHCLVGILRLDSFFVFDIKTKEKKFICKGIDELDRLLLLDDEILCIDNRAVFNLKLSKFILPLAEKNSFIKIYGNIGVLQKGILFVEKEGLQFSSGSKIGLRTWINFIDYDGKQIFPGDFNRNYFYSSNSINNQNYETDMLLALNPTIDDNISNNQIYYFDLKGNQIWPKKPMKASKTDFIKNLEDLNRRLKQTEFEKLSITSEKFNENPIQELKELVYTYIYRKSNPKGNIDILIVQESKVNFINLDFEEIENLETVIDLEKKLKKLKTGDLIITANINFFREEDNSPDQKMRILHIK